MGDGGEAGSQPPGICTYPSFLLCFTGAGTFGISPPNTYMSYNKPTSDLMKGGGHNPTGGYALLFLPLLITTFPPLLSPHDSGECLYLLI